MRKLIKEADPDVVEESKWMGTHRVADQASDFLETHSRAQLFSSQYADPEAVIGIRTVRPLCVTTLSRLARRTD
jgi:hypothetical protein